MIFYRVVALDSVMVDAEAMPTDSAALKCAKDSAADIETKVNFIQTL